MALNQSFVENTNPSQFNSIFTKNADIAFEEFCKKYLNSPYGFYSSPVVYSNGADISIDSNASSKNSTIDSGVYSNLNESLNNVSQNNSYGNNKISENYSKKPKDSTPLSQKENLNINDNQKDLYSSHNGTDIKSLNGFTNGQANNGVKNAQKNDLHLNPINGIKTNRKKSYLDDLLETFDDSSKHYPVYSDHSQISFEQIKPIINLTASTNHLLASPIHQSDIKFYDSYETIEKENRNYTVNLLPKSASEKKTILRANTLEVDNFKYGTLGHLDKKESKPNLALVTDKEANKNNSKTSSSDDNDQRFAKYMTNFLFPIQNELYESSEKLKTSLNEDQIDLNTKSNKPSVVVSFNDLNPFELIKDNTETTNIYKRSSNDSRSNNSIYDSKSNETTQIHEIVPYKPDTKITKTEPEQKKEFTISEELAKYLYNPDVETVSGKTKQQRLENSLSNGINISKIYQPIDDSLTKYKTRLSQFGNELKLNNNRIDNASKYYDIYEINPAYNKMLSVYNKKEAENQIISKSVMNNERKDNLELEASKKTRTNDDLRRRTVHQISYTSNQTNKENVNKRFSEYSSPLLRTASQPKFEKSDILKKPDGWLGLKVVACGMNKKGQLPIPKDNYFIEKGDFGDDAGFWSENSIGDAIGIADGATGNSRLGYDPGNFSRNLMQICSEFFIKENKSVDAKSLLLKAFDVVQDKDCYGSSTACVITLDHTNSKMTVANVGDSGYILFRNGKIEARSVPERITYDCPRQLDYYPWKEESRKAGVSYTDILGNDTICETFTVKKDDIIVLSSDGLFDNLDDDEIEKICQKSKSVLDAAENLVYNSVRFYRKPDDILVIIAKVVDNKESLIHQKYSIAPANK